MQCVCVFYVFLFSDLEWGEGVPRHTHTHSIHACMHTYVHKALRLHILPVMHYRLYPIPHIFPKDSVYIMNICMYVYAHIRNAKPRISSIVSRMHTAYRNLYHVKYLTEEEHR